jgi:hypothetical protein
VSAGLAARLTRDGTGIELLHAMRARRSRRRKGDTSDLETRPGHAELPVRLSMTQERTLTTVEEGTPTTPGMALSGPTPLTGRPWRMPSRLGRFVGDGRKNGVLNVTDVGKYYPGAEPRCNSTRQEHCS